MVLSSLSITQLARLQILLDFKTQAKARVLSVIISGIIGIGCAYHGMEVWALAIQGVVGAFVTSVLLMYFQDGCRVGVFIPIIQAFGYIWLKVVVWQYTYHVLYSDNQSDYRQSIYSCTVGLLQ